MVILQTKLKRLKCKLREFNKRHYADISLKVKNKRQKYETIQNYNLSHQPDAIGSYIPWCLMRRAFFGKSSGYSGYKKEDMNTKFFHSMVAAKHKTNCISKLLDL